MVAMRTGKNCISDFHTARGFNYHEGPVSSCDKMLKVCLLGMVVIGWIFQDNFCSMPCGNNYIKEAIAICNKTLKSHTAILRERIPAYTRTDQ